MKEEYQPAIEALKRELENHQQKVIETKTMINRLSVLGGGIEPYANVGAVSKLTVSSIQPDTFYMKSVITAAREYLDMRKAANYGPASIREIYEALKMGGFIFNSKNETNSQIVVRNALSKASSIFHKLPTGDYGLAKWYDLSKVKKSKNNDESEIESADSDEESADE